MPRSLPRTDELIVKQVSRRFVWALGLAAVATPSSGAWAQPADLPIPAATTDRYPPRVKTARTEAGMVYADRTGRTLYGLDMRVLLRAGPDPAKFCTGECANLWEPLLAPVGTRPNIAFPDGMRQASDDDKSEPTQAKFYSNPQTAPDWTVIAGAQGPQWVYKGWHLVFTRRGDRPGSSAFDGSDEMAWNTLKFVPPEPKPQVPAGIKTLMLDGDHVLADAAGRVLFVGTCKAECSGWLPLGAGMAAAGVGDWSIKRDGDIPQWTRRGQPVFVAPDGAPQSLPPGAKSLKP